MDQTVVDPMAEAVNLKAAAGFWPKIAWPPASSPLRHGPTCSCPIHAHTDRLPGDYRCPDCREVRYSRAPGVWLPIGCACG